MGWMERTVGAVALAWGLGVTAAFAAPAIGEMAPAITATDTKGAAVSLDALRGKTIVLEWTNHQCPYVRKHYESGNMQKLQAEATAADVVWISIISSGPGKQGAVSADEANTLTTDRGAKPTHVVLDADGTIGKAYEAKTTPHMYIIDKDGKLVYMGAIDDKPTAKAEDVAGATNYVTAALADIAAGKPVATAVTESYGCSVKYAE
jgi:peroxiredoxin